MKKLTILALAAIAIIVSSCGHKAPKANLKDEVDTLAYAQAMAMAQQSKMQLDQQGIDSTYYDAFIKGLMEGAKADPKNEAAAKKLIAYFFGLNSGLTLSQGMAPQLEEFLFGNDSTKRIPMDNVVAGFIATLNNDSSVINPRDVRIILDSVSKRYLEKQYKGNIEAGKEYVATFAKQDGVQKLESGVLYKVINEGKGAKPVDGDMVTVHYEGKTIDGKVFDSSLKDENPRKFYVNQVIQGWQEALKAMPVGSKWEVVIPYELAYGEAGTKEIQPYSTLIFTVELISIDNK